MALNRVQLRRQRHNSKARKRIALRPITENTEGISMKVNLRVGGPLVIICPKCGVKVCEQPECVVEYYDPHFTCKACGHTGRVHIARKLKPGRPESQIKRTPAPIKSYRQHKTRVIAA
jgi:hypothetical protein